MLLNNMILTMEFYSTDIDQWDDICITSIEPLLNLYIIQNSRIFLRVCKFL